MVVCVMKLCNGLLEATVEAESKQGLGCDRLSMVWNLACLFWRISWHSTSLEMRLALRSSHPELIL